MKQLDIDVYYSTPKQQGGDFLTDEIQRYIISEFAQKIVDRIEKTEREHCDEYRLKLNVLTDEQLCMMINVRALQMMLEGQVV